MQSTHSTHFAKLGKAYHTWLQGHVAPLPSTSRPPCSCPVSDFQDLLAANLALALRKQNEVRLKTDSGYAVHSHPLVGIGPFDSIQVAETGLRQRR